MYGEDMTNKGVRIEVGDRVRSSSTYAPTPHEGVVQSIALGVTEAGPAPILRVLVDRTDGRVVEPHLHETTPALWDKVFSDGTTVPTQKDFLAGDAAGKCPSCGEHHGTNPFTPEMISIYDRFTKSEDDQERFALLQELGSRFLDELDETDPELPEWAHDMVEEVEKARVKYEKRLLRVGRLVIRNLSEMGQTTAIREHLKGAVLIPIPIPGKEPKGGPVN